MIKENREQPMIVFTQYSPYMLVGFKSVTDAKGQLIKVAPVQSFCRCGSSNSKPLCDGSHVNTGIKGEPAEERRKSKWHDYEGKEIVVHDNRGVCCHDESCITKCPAVFIKGGKPWIQPDNGTIEEIIDTIKSCPSGALSYSLNGVRHQHPSGRVLVSVIKDGPLHVSGGVLLKDDMHSTPADDHQYVLCRCNESKNRPFCDGSHADIDFRG